MSLKKILIKDTLLYTAANYTAMAIGIAVSVVMKMILQAAGAGYWALIKVYISYGEYSDLGVRDALLREIPQASGAHDEKRIETVQSQAFSFSMAASLVAATVIFISSFVVTKDPVLRSGIWVAAGLVIATQAYNFFLTLLRTLKKVPILSLLIVGNMILAGLFPLVLAARHGVLGLALGVLAATILSALLAWRLSRTKITWSWKPDEIKKLLQVGIPMAILSYGLVTFLSLDTILIGRMLGVQVLGYYTIALMAVAQVSTLGRFAHIILFPHIQERAGQAQGMSGTKAIFVRGTQILAHTLPLIIGLGFYFIPPIVQTLLPRFEPGLPAMKILLTGYFFMAVNEMSSTILFTSNRHRLLIPIYALMVVIASGLLFFFIRHDARIESAAMGMSLSYLTFFSLVYFRSFTEILSLKECVMLFARILVVFSVFGCLVWTVDQWVRMSTSVWSQAVLRYIVFAGAYWPIFYWMERREKILSHVWMLMRPKIGVVAHG